jgi:hypothetical protein
MNEAGVVGSRLFAPFDPNTPRGETGAFAGTRTTITRMQDKSARRNKTSYARVLLDFVGNDISVRTPEELGPYWSPAA